MSISLSDALQQVELEVGRVYQCEVGPLRVEVRVEARGSGPLPAPLQESDIMLDPWTALPGPGPGKIVKVTPGGPFWPDPPTIPSDAFER